MFHLMGTLGNMRANLLDPGLLSSSGHHLEYDLRIVAELKSRGFDTHVYSHEQVNAKAREAVSASAPVTPLFRMSPYVNWTEIDPVSGELSAYLDAATMLAGDLAGVREAPIWIWPSLFASHLYACALAKPAAALSACIHVDPTFMAPNGRMWWRHAFLKARDANLRSNLGANVPVLEQEYSCLAGDGRINRFPIAHDGAPSGVCKTGLRRIGFFGHQRPEKGAGLLPSLVLQLLRDGYEVVIQDSGDFVRAEGMPGLVVLSYVPCLADEIAKCDLVVAPYDPAAYRTKGSGIVWDSVASGVPVIAPADTAIGSFVRSTGAGVLFAALDVADVYRAILEAGTSYEQIAKAAFRASLEWRGRHGIKHFVSALLGNPGTSLTGQGMLCT